MPLPLKLGESPELDAIVERIMEAVMAPNDLAPEIRRTLTTTLARYGDRRGEEERAKREESGREWCKRRDDAIAAYIRAMDAKNAEIERLKAAVAEERAKALGEAALFAVRRADECEARAKALPVSDHESLVRSVAAITWQAAADHLRSLAAAPSGDAKGTR